MTMRLCLVFAMARNRVIGREGDLPWRIPADLKLFKAVTMGKPLIMGRKTFESIGRPLPGRTNIVVTRRMNFQAEGIIIAHDFDDARLRAAEVAKTDGVEEIMVIGGAEIYSIALPTADRLYLTEVKFDADGDTLFPAFDHADWRESDRIDCPPEGETPGYAFVVLDRQVIKV